MALKLASWFKAARPAGADAAYIALLAQARKAFFYERLAVPDTIDGRFEMIVLHLFLAQHRLLNEPAHTEFARGLGEAFFDDMERALREFGVADTGVAKRIKAMGKAYHGRLQAYEAGLRDREAMRSALARNLYGTLGDGNVAVLDGMRDYMQRELAALAAAPIETITTGSYAWGEPSGR